MKSSAAISWNSPVTKGDFARRAILSIGRLRMPPKGVRGARKSSGGGAADRFAVARQLQEIGGLMELGSGTDRFKARAYKRGARALLQFGGDLDRAIREGRLTEISGIGSALSAQIEEIHRKGTSSLLEKLRSRYPAGVLELSRVPSLSLKKIEQLSRELGITSLAELRAAAEAGRLRDVKGFGAKTESNLLRSLADLEGRGGNLLLIDARRVAREIIDYLLLHGEGQRAAELSGPARRFHETVTRVSLVAAARSPARVISHFLTYPMIADTLERDRKHAVVRLADGTEAELVAVTPAHYPAALLYETGSAGHLGELEEVARRKGKTLSPRGLYGRRGTVERTASEARIYQGLGMQFVPPELREGEGEVEAALAGTLAPDLVTEEDIRGLVHCHTHYSDGKNSVEEMALAAEARGADYLTITDHSPTASYAGGLKLDRLMKLWDEIDRVQERVSITILKGTESDILADGQLDYPDRILERFDIIIASIHARMKMDERQMTRRVLGAVRQPLFKVWGHPLGRLIERRPPIPCRVLEILDAIAETGLTAIEINGDPHRLDLEPRWVREARLRGIKFVISTDAHSVAGLGNLKLGVGIARRAGVTRGEVLNTLPVRDFMRAVHPLATRGVHRGGKPHRRAQSRPRGA